MLRALVPSSRLLTGVVAARQGGGAAAANRQLCFRRDFSSSSDGTPESKMEIILRDELGAQHVEIEDISGGCGSMYKMFVVSEEFEGLNQVKKHRLVQRALAAEIADMHGLTLKTQPASKFKGE